jgi:hypothetical protein
MKIPHVQEILGIGNPRRHSQPANDNLHRNLHHNPAISGLQDDVF